MLSAMMVALDVEVEGRKVRVFMGGVVGGEGGVDALRRLSSQLH